jgi:Nuclease-related domain
LVSKKRSIPLKILILIALLRRLPKNHPKRPHIVKELARRTAGYQGEVSLDSEIDRLFEKNFLILHDLNLHDGNTFYQIDNLLLSPN